MDLHLKIQVESPCCFVIKNAVPSLCEDSILRMPSLSVVNVNVSLVKYSAKYELANWRNEQGWFPLHLRHELSKMLADLMVSLTESVSVFFLYSPWRRERVEKLAIDWVGLYAFLPAILQTYHNCTARFASASVPSVFPPCRRLVSSRGTGTAR